MTRSPLAGTLAALGVCAVATLGCVFVRYQTETPRSATEQLLLSGAIETAIDRLAWPELTGHAVSVESVALNPQDAPYLVAVGERHARTLGARVVAREEAELAVQLQAGAIGTASRQSAFGIPSLPTPFGVPTPQITFLGVTRQRGYARVRLVVFDRDGGRVAESPAVLERKSFDVYSFLFLAVRRNDIYPDESFQLGVD